MIQIIREEVSPQADSIEAEFRELVLAYDRVITTPGQAYGAGHALPAVRDGERVASGEDEIAAYLKELKRFVRDWRMFEGDTCYVNEDGETC
jgi:hypothetical protein